MLHYNKLAINLQRNDLIYFLINPKNILVQKISIWDKIFFH